MIAWRGERVVQISKMILPGDIRLRAKLPHVAGLAEELRRELVPPPALRKNAKGRWELVTESGKDIAAAHVLLQWADLRGREMVCSPQEARLWALAEQRRGLSDVAKLAALNEQIESLEAELLANPQPPPSVQRGRRRSAKSQAVHEVARLTGLDERSLMRAHRRATQGDPDFAEPVVAAGPVILDLGMPLEPSFMAHVSEVQAATTAALDGLSRAIRAVAKLETLPYPKHALVSADLQELKEKLSKHWPFSLCPYCKGLSGVQEGCAACSMQGWLGKGQVDSVPDKLWDKVDRVVMVHGKPRRVADLLPNTELP